MIQCLLRAQPRAHGIGSLASWQCPACMCMQKLPDHQQQLLDLLGYLLSKSAVPGWRSWVWQALGAMPCTVFPAG